MTKSNIQNFPLIDKTKIILSPLHIKLGLRKNFIEAIIKEERRFKYFTSLRYAKIKEDIFDGPQIRHLIKGDNFMDTWRVNSFPQNVTILKTPLSENHDSSMHFSYWVSLSFGIQLIFAVARKLCMQRITDVLARLPYRLKFSRHLRLCQSGCFLHQNLIKFLRIYFLQVLLIPCRLNTENILNPYT